MVAKAQEKIPATPERDSVAAAEVSLYRNVLKIKQDYEASKEAAPAS